MIKYLFSSLWLICSFIWLPSLESQDIDLSEESSPITLFQAIAAFEGKPTIKITTNTKQLIRKKLKEEYQSAEVVVSIGDESWEFTTQLRARGNIRKEVCYYPPLKIKFAKEELEAKGFKKTHKLKLVLPCKDTKGAVDALHKENLLYDIYRELDPHHILTKLVTIELWNDKGMWKQFDGFVVEEEKHFQKRYDAIIIEKGKLISTKLVRDQYTRMCFFQFMIANTDWSIYNKHNVEVVALGAGQYISVPYDFDYSGLINNSYAVPSETLNLKRVTNRLFLGKRITHEEAFQAAKFFNDKREVIEGVCMNSTYLKESSKKSVSKFIADFYKYIDSDKEIKRYFVNYKKKN